MRKPRKPARCAAAAACLLVLTVPAAFAADVTFQRSVSPSGYTQMYDNSVSPTATSTAKTNPTVIYLNNPSGGRMVCHFDLSSIPAGSTVTQATLQYNFYNGSAINKPVGVYRATRNWTGGEGWIIAGGNWADKNSAAQGTVPYASVTANFNGWFSWDVTQLVQEWVNGASPNYGFFIKVDGSASSYGQTYASGHSSASVHPKLRVIYSAQSAPPADTTPPAGSVAINNNAVATQTTAVILALSATDNSGSVAQMQFSNDGTSYSNWENYAATKNWTLAGGDDAKTVYVKFKDAAGNESAAAMDTITLDTAAPILTIISPGDGQVIVVPLP